MMKLGGGERAVLAFNPTYIAGFLAYNTLVSNRDFGGYFNTALDLVFNALGVISAMIICAFITGAANSGSSPKA